MRDVFLPFTIDKRFWNKKLPIVFLNKVYERQIDDDVSIHYKTLMTCHPRNDQRCELFIANVVNTLGKILNQYHDLHESDDFWEKMLYFWVKEYVCSIRFKIDQLNNLKKEYPPDLYSYYTYAGRSWKSFNLFSLEDSHSAIFFEEAYHFISYLWLAERFYNIHVEEIDSEIYEMNSPMVKKEFILNILRNIRDGLINFTKIFPSRMRVGTVGALEGRFSWIKWFFWSKGAIRRLLIPDAQCSAFIDNKFRSQLKEKILEDIKITQEEEMILDFLPRVFPRFFVEDFKVQYDIANVYLEKHPNLSIIFTSTLIVEKSVQKICMLLLQKRGGKVLGQQHGGNYNISWHPIDYLRELEMDDIFYFWGEALPDRTGNMNEISYAPCWKLNQHDKESEEFGKGAGYILFTGTAVQAYPRSYFYGFVDEKSKRYLDLEMRLFSMLDKEVQSHVLFRPHPSDYGWHVLRDLCSIAPDIKIDIQTDFKELLANCSLYIVDHIATTWLEALYINKPTIIFIPLQSSISYNIIRKEEKKYFDMLEEIGVVFHSPEEVATHVNRIMKRGIMDWWMEERRQRTLQLLMKRWTTKVADIDDWWYHELMLQAEKAERGA